MALTIKNPYFKSQVEQRAAQQVSALDNWLKANPGRETFTIADLKAAFPAAAATLTREVVNQACSQLGLVVVNPEDPEA